MKQRRLKNIRSAEDIVGRLLKISATEDIYLLDSGGAGHGGSRLMICGLRPSESLELRSPDPLETLRLLDQKLASNLFSIFTIAYDFGLKLHGIESRDANADEPDFYLALFECLLVHDYESGETRLVGSGQNFEELEKLLSSSDSFVCSQIPAGDPVFELPRADYLEEIANIQELIRSGQTYQTNFTHRVRADLPPGLTPADVFHRLRRDHPAPFAAFIQRRDSTVVSASPERFFSINGRRIEASPIKGTRRRGSEADEDERLRDELTRSEKDRAENVMIVDLLRNDLGRVCEFGSVTVEQLCAVEEHPSLFHLVSTISGSLRPEIGFADVLKALFPCGSITGAPKISTMRIIDAAERSTRGLSMGAIGYFARDGLGVGGRSETRADLSVAIRTMVVRGTEATFNVGGGIVIDSGADDEYRESLLKAKALIAALKGKAG